MPRSRDHMKRIQRAIEKSALIMRWLTMHREGILSGRLVAWHMEQIRIYQQWLDRLTRWLKGAFEKAAKELVHA